MRLSGVLAVALYFITFATNANAANKYNKDYIGETVVHKAVFEDTLIHLARNNDMGFVEVRAANPLLDSWIPGAGAKVILPKQHILPDAVRNGLVINLAEMRIYYYKEAGQPPQTYPISIGREGLQTPTGTTKIVRKQAGPTWRPTPRMREEHPELPEAVPPGPENPLGTHAMYLGWPQYLMHGTNKPYGVGRRVSSGCMRMYPEDIKTLFPQVPVGTSVTVVDQPVKVGWIDDGLFIEVSPTQDQSLKIEEDGELKPYEMTPEDISRINKKAGDQADKINWDIVKKAVAEHRGYPIEIMNLAGRKLSEAVQSEPAPQVLEAKPEPEVTQAVTPKTEAANVYTTSELPQKIVEAEPEVELKIEPNKRRVFNN